MPRRNYAEQFPPARDNRFGLTPPELAALQSASAGRTAKGTAAAFGRSERTIETHLAECRRKLGALTVTHAVVIALREGVLRFAESLPQSDPAEPIAGIDG